MGVVLGPDWSMEEPGAMAAAHCPRGFPLLQQAQLEAILPNRPMWLRLPHPCKPCSLQGPSWGLTSWCPTLGLFPLTRPPRVRHSLLSQHGAGPASGPAQGLVYPEPLAPGGLAAVVWSLS